MLQLTQDLMSTQQKLVVYVRWLSFLALIYLLSFGAPGSIAPQVALIVVAALSNVGLSRLSVAMWDHPVLLPAITLLDVSILTSSMVLGSGFNRDLLFVYFVLVALVAAAPSLKWGTTAAAGALSGYAVYLSLENGRALLQSPELIGQIGLLFSAAIVYAGLTEASKVRLQEAAAQGQLVSWVDKMSAAFSEDFDAIELIRQVLIDAQRTFSGNARSSLVELTGEVFQVIASSDDREFRDRPLNLDLYPELRLVVNGTEPIVIDDIKKDPITAPVREQVEGLEFSSLLICPVLLDGDSNDGMDHIVLRVARSHGVFTPSQVATAQHLASAIALIFRQARMRDSVEKNERMALVTQITSGVSDSFGDILQTVLVSAELLRKEVVRQQNGGGAVRFDREAMSRFDAIDVAVREGLTITERLGAWTQLGNEAGSAEARDHQVLAPASVMEDAWRYAQPHWIKRSASRPLEFGTAIEVDPPKITGNAAELREVLIHLIENAIDAMPKGGVLTLGLRSTEDSVVFTVSDTGVGIAPENRHKIFDPLFTTKGSAGTGLGLNIAKSVATRHNGTLRLDPTTSIGTSFEFSLPIATDQEELDDGAEPVALAALSRRVLLVENNRLVRDVMERALEASDIDVDTVASVDEAEVLLQTERHYDGLVVDAQIPPSSLGSFLDAVLESRPELSTRVLFYSNGRPSSTVVDLQAGYGYSYVDRSAGLAALKDALEELSSGGSQQRHQAA